MGFSLSFVVLYFTIQSSENHRKECHTLTSHSDSDFKRSNISFKGNKPDGFSPNSNGLYTIAFERKKEELYDFRQPVLVDVFQHLLV